MMAGTGTVNRITNHLAIEMHVFSPTTTASSLYRNLPSWTCGTPKRQCHVNDFVHLLHFLFSCLFFLSLALVIRMLYYIFMGNSDRTFINVSCSTHNHFFRSLSLSVFMWNLLIKTSTFYSYRGDGTTATAHGQYHFYTNTHSIMGLGVTCGPVFEKKKKNRENKMGERNRCTAQHTCEMRAMSIEHATTTNAKQTKELIRLHFRKICLFYSMLSVYVPLI